MSTTLALILAFLSGYIALSYEIVWYRAYSMAMMGRAQAFGLLLGGYLGGIALGSFISRWACVDEGDRRRVLHTLAGGLVAANVLGFLFVPLLARLVTVPHAWGPATALLALSAAGLGAVFPLVAQLAIRERTAVGRGVSYIYVANVLGSASGSLLTGLMLLDHLTLRALTTALGVTGVGCAVAVFVAGAPGWRRAGGGPAIAAAGAAAAMIVCSPALFANVYEKLVFTKTYRPGMHFAHIVENRHGVIAVTPTGEVYGSGAYDGAFNTDLRDDARNGIRRAYAAMLLHPAPARVLMIGLSTGSWAEVIANLPSVERVTVIEINPGYLKLLPFYPPVAPLVSDRRVQIEIDDGRRWLTRHPSDRFDLIVANTAYNWRSNATSLLSQEFLELVRAHLAPGGLYYYNTTGEGRVQRTGATVFPYAWRVDTMLAVSDAPFAPDFERFRLGLLAYRPQRGATRLPVLETGQADRIVEILRSEVEPRDSLLARTASLTLITDDNMGTEWKLPRQLWTY